MKTYSQPNNNNLLSVQDKPLEHLIADQSETMKPEHTGCTIEASGITITLPKIGEGACQIGAPVLVYNNAEGLSDIVTQGNETITPDQLSSLRVESKGDYLKLVPVSSTEWGVEAKNRKLVTTDFDISASNQEFSMTTPNMEPVGHKLKVSWFGGDGSNTFSFINATGLTLNGIPFDDWVGQGTGGLELEKLSATEWQATAIGGGDTWDSRKSAPTIFFQKDIWGSAIVKRYDSLTGITASTSSDPFGSTAGLMYVYFYTFPFEFTFADTTYHINFISDKNRPITPLFSIRTTTEHRCTVWSPTNFSDVDIWTEISGVWTTNTPRLK